MLNFDYLISVIVPFYKGETYIEQCVKSILNQPYKNIELLLINDGSPSGDHLCKEIASNDKRISYHFKKNEGTGAARNYGLKKAKGEYVAFLDQDDVWVNDFLNEDVIIALKGNDILAFSYYVTDSHMRRGNSIRVKPQIILHGGFNAIEKCWMHHSCMIYNKKFLIDNNISYALSRHEDLFFIHKAAYLSNRIEFIDRLMFLYRNNITSETHRKKHSEEIYIPLLETWKDLLEWHIHEHPDDRQVVAYIKHMICVYAIEGLELLYQENRKEKCTKDIAKTYFEKYLKNYNEDIISSPWQIERIQLYFLKYKRFVLLNRYKGIKRRILKKIGTNTRIRYWYEKKKYKEILDCSICVR